MHDFERGPVSRPALSRLLGVTPQVGMTPRVGATPQFGVTPQVFADEYWAQGPLLSRAESGRDFVDLFSADAVDELVSRRGLRTPFVRMASEGSVLAPGRYTASGGFGAEIADQLSADKVLDEFADGATLVLQGLHRTWAPLADFTRHLVADLGHPCQVNAYITPASARGFDSHYDVHDVFVLQISGEKHWMIHPPVHTDPLGNQPWTDHRHAVAERASAPAAIDETLRPGDVLYLPRGWLHSATALGGTSIHLTVGVAALTRYDIVEQLLTRAGREQTLRQSLPLGIDVGDPEQLRAIVEATIADLTAQLRSDGAVAEVLSERLGQRLRDSTRPEPVRPLATIEALATLDESSTVSWRHGLAGRISREETTVSIILPSKTVTLPAEAADAIATLRSGQVVGAGELPGLDVQSSLVLSRRLVREGILVVR